MCLHRLHLCTTTTCHSGGHHGCQEARAGLASTRGGRDGECSIAACSSVWPSRSSPIASAPRSRCEFACASPVARGSTIAVSSRSRSKLIRAGPLARSGSIGITGCSSHGGTSHSRDGSKTASCRICVGRTLAGRHSSGAALSKVSDSFAPGLHHGGSDGRCCRGTPSARLPQPKHD
jgi:hypothetical protein